jgi:hypothetical protein
VGRNRESIDCFPTDNAGDFKAKGALSQTICKYNSLQGLPALFWKLYVSDPPTGVG